MPLPHGLIAQSRSRPAIAGLAQPYLASLPKGIADNSKCIFATFAFRCYEIGGFIIDRIDSSFINELGNL